MVFVSAGIFRAPWFDYSIYGLSRPFSARLFRDIIDLLKIIIFIAN
nr:MAG TPA: hypothetical protein [Caudoviricetes sp.]